MILKRRYLFLCFILLGCDPEMTQTGHSLYSFPPLSQGQLVDLKKQSEEMEGFFITTNLSDGDSAWAERGFYIYVCIRFLNDPDVNEKIKRSALPLLIQVSTKKDRPEAESILLLHPDSLKPSGIELFYKERRLFEFTYSPMNIGEQNYEIFDVNFNSKSKISELFFLKEGTSLKELEQTSLEEENNETEEEDDDYDDDEVTSNTKQKIDSILKITSFAKQFTSSCTDWPLLNFEHSEELPSYLTVEYTASSDSENEPQDDDLKNDDLKNNDNGNDGNNNIGSSDTAQISEEAPHTAVPQTQ